MNHLSQIAAVVTLAASVTACVKDDNGNVIENPVEVAATTVDYFSGANVDQATVTLTWTTDEGVASYTAVTDANGAAVVYYPEAATDITVYSDATDYAEYGRELEPASEEATVLLVPVDATVTFDNAVANELVVNGDVVISLPADAFGTEDGQSYNGQVIAEITIIDPRMDPALMPGQYETIDPATGEVAVIESFGAINATFASPDGTSLQIAEGQSAEVRIPLAAEPGVSPQTIPLYYYDDESGYWIEEGIAALTQIGSAWFYVGTVTHFTTWNADRVYETVFVNGCVATEDGSVVSGANVASTGVDYTGTSYVSSDVNGLFSLPVRMNSELYIQASQGALMSGSERIYTSANDLNLSSCLILEPVAVSIQVSWGSAPMDLDSHLEGPDFHVYYADSTATSGADTFTLDKDTVDGFGPETILISSTTVDATYTYSVFQYSQDSNIADSPTRVQVQVGDSLRVFTPPAGTPTECWTVFEMTVTGGVPAISEVGTWTDEAACYGSAYGGGSDDGVVLPGDGVFAPASVQQIPVKKPRTRQVQ